MTDDWINEQWRILADHGLIDEEHLQKLRRPASVTAERESKDLRGLQNGNAVAAGCGTGAANR